MKHVYEYTGDGSHHFSTLGLQPKPGELIPSDEPLNSAFLREITAQAKQSIAAPDPVPVAVQAPAQENEVDPKESTQAEVVEQEDEHEEPVPEVEQHEDEQHTEGVEE